jgi:hypothetical protein
VLPAIIAHYPTSINSTTDAVAAMKVYSSSGNEFELMVVSIFKIKENNEQTHDVIVTLPQAPPEYHRDSRQGHDAT